MKKLLTIAVAAAAIGAFAPAASASCRPNPTDIGPACLETAVCNAVGAVIKNADCIE